MTATERANRKLDAFMPQVEKILNDPKVSEDKKHQIRTIIKAIRSGDIAANYGSGDNEEPIFLEEHTIGSYPFETGYNNSLNNIIKDRCKL